MLTAIQMLCVILQYVYDNILSSESVETLNILLFKGKYTTLFRKCTFKQKENRMVHYVLFYKCYIWNYYEKPNLILIAVIFNILRKLFIVRCLVGEKRWQEWKHNRKGVVLFCILNCKDKSIRSVYRCLAVRIFKAIICQF